MVICLENGPATMRTLAKEALARWVTPYPDRTIPLVRQLIDRMKQGPFPGDEAMCALVHLGTELLEDHELFVDEVYNSAQEEIYFEQLKRMVMMAHIAEKELSERGPWIQIVQMFMECRDALLNTLEHQAAIQKIFLDEIMHFFAYDIGLQLRAAQESNVEPIEKLKLVMRILVQHLEDFNVRIKCRDFVFDEDTQQLVRMSSLNRMRLYNRVTLLMTEPLTLAFLWAAGHVDEEEVEKKRIKCGQLLEDKTRITAETHDQEMHMYHLLLDAVTSIESEETDWLHHQLTRALVTEAAEFLPSVEIKMINERLRKVRVRSHRSTMRSTVAPLNNALLYRGSSLQQLDASRRPSGNSGRFSGNRASEPGTRRSRASSHLIFPSDVAPSTLLQ